MRKSLVYILSIGLLLAGCKQQMKSGKSIGKKVNIQEFVRSKPVKPLVQIYYEHGNFINTKEFPPIVSAAKVLEHYKEWLIIDLRRPDAYEAGHIPGAYNVPKNKVLDFLMKKHKAAAYPKVVFVCYTGQTASYVTGITRYAGFDNTYAMLFGMAAWNDKFSAPLRKGVGNRYPEMVETGEQKSPLPIKKQPGNVIDWRSFPSTGKNLPTVSIARRAQKLLEAPRKDFLLKADEFFPDYKAHPLTYQPVCYLPKSKFVAGHIKGSWQFTPRRDFSPDAKLSAVPQDKTVLVYCKSGHTGSNTAAYLNMIGYHAKNLILGSMSYIYDIWKKNEWAPDVDALINNYPLVEGKKPFSGKALQTQAKTVKKAAVPIVKHKKKEVTGGCG